MPEPIRPTRVIPSAELPPPRPAPAPSAPPAPPGETDTEWWTADFSARDVLVIHHVYDVLVARTPPAVPEPGWDWSVLWSWPRWRHAGGAVAALAPLFGGWSCATGWGRALRSCRTEQTIGGAWTLGVLALLVTVTVVRWRPRWYTTAALITALFGIAAMASPYDLVTFVTGVHQ